MREDTLLSLSVEIDTEERYLALLQEHMLDDDCQGRELDIVQNTILDTIKKLDSLKDKYRKLHGESSELLQSLGLPTYKSFY